MARIHIFMGFIMLFMTLLTLLSYNPRIYQNKFKFQQKFLTNENQKKKYEIRSDLSPVLINSSDRFMYIKLFRQIIVDILRRIL